MKQTLNIVFFILLCTNCFSQTKVIQFLDGNTSVPNVTVIDSVKNLSWESDENGKIYLTDQDYVLQISHVGYFFKKLIVSTDLKVNPIKVQLVQKVKDELEVKLNSKKSPKGNIFYKRKRNSGDPYYRFRTQQTYQQRRN